MTTRHRCIDDPSVAIHEQFVFMGWEKGRKKCMNSLKRKINDLQKWVVTKWSSSHLFNLIDRLISKHFQKRLKNDDFTILCSNCIGGTIYHRLGKRFLSPTINLYFFQPDFVSFCLNLDYYLAQEPVFIQSEHDFPVAHLEGNGAGIPTITVFFNHDREEETAKKSWEDRKKRIRRDNLFIILYKLDGVTVDQLRRLEQVSCKNKVVLTSKPLPEISWSHYIKPNMRHPDPYNYLKKNMFGVRYYERKFDIVSFLNCSK